MYIATLLFVIGLGVSGQSQPAECAVDCLVSVGQPFIAFTESDATVDEYMLFINGQQSLIKPTFVDGYVEFAHPGFSTIGTMSVVIRARDVTTVFDYTNILPISVVKRRIRIQR